MSMIDKITQFLFNTKINKQEVQKASAVSQYSLQWLADNWATQSNTKDPVANSSILFRCIQIITDNISEAPLKFKNRGSNKDLEYTNPIVRLFDLPDGENPYPDFVAKSALYYALYGECFWFLNPYIDQSGRMVGKIQNITVLHPKYMFERLNSNNKIMYWDYNPDNFAPKVEDESNQRLPVELVVHIKNANPYNHNRGLSVLKALNDKLLINRRALEFEANFLKNGAAPNLVITQDQKLEGAAVTNPKELQKIVKLFDQRHRGPRKAGKTGILTPGLDIKQVGLDHDKMQFIEILKYTDEEIITALGLHKTILGKTEDINRAISQDQREMLWQYSLKPITTKFKYAINYRILKLIDMSVEAYYDYSQVMPAQRLTVEHIPALMNAGFTRNEINRRLGLNFDEDPTGDVRLVPFNTVTLDSVINDRIEKKMLKVMSNQKQIEWDDNVKKKYSENEVEKSAKRSMVLQARRTQQLLERKLRGKIKKYGIIQKKKVLEALEKHQIKAFDEADASILINNIEPVFNAEETQRLENTLLPAYEEIIITAGDMAYKFIDIDRDYILNTDVLQNRMNKVKDINITTFNDIKFQISDALEGVRTNGKTETIQSIAKRIRGVYSGFDKHRSLLIARTETTALISETTQKEYITNGIKKNSWHTAGDIKVRDSHRANAAQGPIPVGESFQNGETYPQAPNCRCVLIPEVN